MHHWCSDQLISHRVVFKTLKLFSAYWNIILGMELLIGTVPVNNSLLTGTVPANNLLLTGTVPVNNLLLTGTVPGPWQ